MKELMIINQNGRLLVDSRDVAEMVEKRHDHLLRDINGYVEVLRKSIDPKIGVNDFFIDSSYQDSIGRTLPCYQITKKGCEMVANKLTGEKGILFTAAYVTRFEEMKKALQSNPYAGLSPELQAIFITDKKVQAVEIRVEKLENTMTIDYTQQETLRELANKTVINALGGKSSLAYKMIAGKAFSEIWRYFKRTMNVNSYKNTAVVDYEKAKEIILMWKPDKELGLMITGANVQGYSK